VISFSKPIAFEECEEAIIIEKKIIYEDAKHSSFEKRYLLLGQTNSERKLAIIFTIRENKIRVISARDMNKKEQIHYEEQTKNNS
jgi:uncharacterized DUF497 family protein